MAELVAKARLRAGSSTPFLELTAFAYSLSLDMQTALLRLQGVEGRLGSVLDALLAQVVTFLDCRLSFWCVLCLNVLASLLLNLQS